MEGGALRPPQDFQRLTPCLIGMEATRVRITAACAASLWARRVIDGSAVEERQLGEQILGQVNLHLQAQGVRITTGTIVDATILHAPTSTILTSQSGKGIVHTLALLQCFGKLQKKLPPGQGSQRSLRMPH